MEKYALRVRAYLSACKTRPPHPAALNGRQCPPRQMLESDGFDNRGPADKMHAVDHMDATSCWIAHQVDTQWPAGHMKQLKRCQTNEKDNVQSLFKRKKSTFSQCECTAPVPSSAADKMHAVDHMDATSCRIAHQVDTQWPAGHMRQLKRCRTNEKNNVQSLLKRKRSRFSQCEWASASRLF